MSSNNDFKNVSNPNLSVEMIEKIQRMRVMFKKDKSIVVDEDDSSDFNDDSWLCRAYTVCRIPNMSY